MNANHCLLALCVASALVLGSCGTEAPAPGASSQPGGAAATSDLTAVELEQGIGPIRDLELGPLDAGLAAEGEARFTTKCSACHKLDERYVAPALGDVLSRRRPEFVMNMILNATEMVQRHPETRRLLAEFYTPMPVQVTHPEGARAILEYLRAHQSSADSASK